MSCSYNMHLGFLVNTIFLGAMEWSFSFELCTCWHHIKAKKLCSCYLLLIKYSDSIKWQQWSRWERGSVCYCSSRVMVIVTFKVTQHKTVIFHFKNNGISTTIVMRFEVASVLCCFLSLKCKTSGLKSTHKCVRWGFIELWYLKRKSVSQ